MGGFIKGMAVGLASFALGFAVLSVVLEPDPRPEATVSAPDSASVTGPEAEAPEADPAETGARAPDAVADAAPDLVPEGEEGSSDRLNDAVAEALAEAAEVATAEGDAAPDVADEPAQGTQEPDAPAATVDPPMPTPLAEAGAPDEGGVAAQDAGPEAPTETPIEAPTDDQTETPAEDPALPEAEAIPEQDIPAVPEALTEPEEQPEPEPIGETQTPPETGTESEAEAEVAPSAPPVLRAVPASPGLGRSVEGVTVGRLPSIAADEDGAGAEPAPRADAESDTQADATPGHDADARPARLRYAAEYDPASGPLFAVILLDAPADPAAEAAIVALPMPVAVALDPDDPDAPRRAQAYRAAGHEVVIHAAGLPQGATASDLDVTFDAWFRALPEAVALIAPAEGGFQGNRGLAQAVMPYLADDGHGLITHERGLNPAQQSANSAGVANAAVFRIIDSDDENQFTIRRYLDRATFRAQQEGQVVVMGRAAHADTIDGLIGWRMEGRAGQVAIVPVSATLRLP